ncbi:MAG: WD40 repeat domain-containing protein, partial [Planctomycetota bacterium]
TPEGMGEVATLQISPDQRYLVSSDFHVETTLAYHTRRLWDLETRQELKDVHLPSGSDRGFAFSNSGKHLALHRGAVDLHGGDVSQISEICIYDTATWDLKIEITLPPLDTLRPKENEVRFLSFSPDDTTLATIGQSEAILWNWRAGERIYTWSVEDDYDSAHVLAFFPDGQYLAIGDNKGLKIVDLTTRDIEHPEAAAGREITALAVSPDSRYVAIGSGYDNAEIGVLNTASWEPEAPLLGHGGTVSSLVFSSDECLISSSSDSTIRVWDMNSRDTIRVLKGHQSEVCSVSLTRDGTRAISAGSDKQILEWDLTAARPAIQGHLLPERVEKVVFSADNPLFYALNEGSVSIWDAKELSKQPSSFGGLGEKSTIILSPDGKHLIAGTGTGDLWVLDAEDLHVVTKLRTEGRNLPVGFLADGRSLVVLEPYNTISFWDTETWKMRPGAETGLRIVFFPNNSNFNLYAIPPESDVLLYPSSGKLVWWDLERSKELAHIRVNSRYPGCIAVSPTEPLLASAARGDFIALWNWQTREFKEHCRGPKAFRSVTFSPDGRRMLTGGRGKGALMLWDVSIRPVQEIAQFGSSSMDLAAVQFSPDGNTICGVDWGGNAYFFQAPSLDRIKTLAAEQSRKKTR